jgi:4-amino-4-deoxy-L-arabinose transferase-like glycosyltransferase
MVTRVAKGRRTWLLVGVVGLAFALRVAGLDSQSLWRDEVDAIRFATSSWNDLLRMFVVPGQNGPLYYLALRPWLYLAGWSEYALRFFSVFFGTLAVPLVYRLARRLFPSLPSLALLAATFTATSPYLVWYGQEGKMYSLVLALVLLSMDRYLAALEKGGWQRWLLYVAFTGTAIYVHLIAALMVPVQIVAFLLMGGETRKARWKAWLASTGVLLLPYLPLLRWQLPLVLSPADTGYQFVPLQQMLVSLLTNYSLGLLIPGSLQWAAGIFVVLLLATAWLWRDHRSRLAPLGILACWLCIPVLGLFFLTLMRPMYTARYLIFVLPAYLILLAAGVVAIARRSQLLAGLLLAALLVTNVLGLWRQASTPLKADFRSATEYMAGRMSPDDLLLFQIPYGRHSFDYYLPRYQEQHQQNRPDAAVTLHWSPEYRMFMPVVTASAAASYRWADGLYTNAGMDLGAAHLAMERLTAGTETVWLIATEVDLWDERGLVQSWLDQRASMADEAHFVGVSVYQYRLR